MIKRRESGAGIAAFCGRLIPSASTWVAIVEAVPITLQTPVERLMPVCASMKLSRLIRPARISSLKRQTSVPDPMS